MPTKEDYGKRDMPADPNITLVRLARQINYFNERSRQNQIKFKYGKGITYLAGVLITITAAFHLPGWVPGSLGAVIVFSESLLGMNSCHQNWLSYRRSCQSLTYEKYSYLQKSGPYRDAEEPEILLSERIESIISSDHEIWLSSRQEQAKALPPVSTTALTTNHDHVPVTLRRS